MKALIFNFKRLLVTPWFSVFLLLVLIAPVFARRAAADVAVPLMAVVFSYPFMVIAGALAA